MYAQNKNSNRRKIQVKTFSSLDERDSNSFDYETKEQFYLTGPWSKDEHNKLIKACIKYGKNWEKIAREIGTRTTAQIRSHAQKFLIKLCLNNNIKLKCSKFKQLSKRLALRNKRMKKKEYSLTPEEAQFINSLNYYQRVMVPFSIKKEHRNHTAEECLKGSRGRANRCQNSNRQHIEHQNQLTDYDTHLRSIIEEKNKNNNFKNDFSRVSKNFLNDNYSNSLNNSNLYKNLVELNGSITLFDNAMKRSSTLWKLCRNEVESALTRGQMQFGSFNDILMNNGYLYRMFNESLESLDSMTHFNNNQYRYSNLLNNIQQIMMLWRTYVS